MLFQSIGAHYTAKTAFKHLVTIGNTHSVEALKAELYGMYGGEAVLYHKGRAALADAVRLAAQGGSVAVSGLTCYSVPQAVRAGGAEPIYVEIRESDLQFGPAELEAAARAHADMHAVIVQNTLGVPADMTGIEKVAAKYKLVIIEDLAHSAGASYADGRLVGTVGDLVMLSFGRDKAVDVVNGGALIIREPRYLPAPSPKGLPSFVDQARDRIYPVFGWLSRSLYGIGIGRYLLAGAYRLGWAVRSADGAVKRHQGMPAWQAKAATLQLRALNARVVWRRHTAQLLDEATDYPIVSGATQPGASLVRVPFLMRNRDEVVQALRTKGIHVEDIWYDTPVSPRRYYKKAQFPEHELPVAVRVAGQLLNIPTHENVTPYDIETIHTIIDTVAQR